MSQYWFFRCKTCDEESERINHGRDTLVNMASHSDCFICLKDHFDIGFNVYSSGMGSTDAIIDFMCEHRSHELEVACEYGDTNYPPVPVSIQW